MSATYNLTNDPTGTACGFIQSTDLWNKNPLLGHLASNGGPTQTMLPAAKSPAADVIPKPTTLRGVAVCPGTDQRGVTRPGHGETQCTIGAAEVGFKNATSTSVTANLGHGRLRRPGGLPGRGDAEVGQWRADRVDHLHHWVHHPVHGGPVRWCRRLRGHHRPGGHRHRHRDVLRR